MRILFVTQEFPFPPTEGIKCKVYDLIRYFVKRHEVHVISFYNPDEHVDIDAMSDMGCQVLGIFPKINIGIKEQIKNLFEQYPLSLKRYQSQDFTTLFLKVIGATQYDVIHLDTVNMAQFIEYTNSQTTVAAPNDCTALFYERQAKNTSNIFRKVYLLLQTSKMKAYERDIYAKFTKCYFVSKLERDYLIQLNRKIDAEVIPLGVDADFFSPNGKHVTDANSMIFTGNFGGHNNSDPLFYFIRSILPDILRDFPEARFKVVGMNPPEEIVRLAKEDNRIEVTGYVEDICSYLESATVYVCPMLYGTGIKTKVLQAMSMAKPIVSTSVGVDNLDVISGEHLIVADDPGSFSKAVVRLLKDESLRNKLGVAARQLVEIKYSHSKVGEQVEKLYYAACDKKDWPSDFY